MRERSPAQTPPHFCFARFAHKHRHIFATPAKPNLPCAVLLANTCHAEFAALPNSLCFAKRHHTPHFHPTHKAQAPPRSKALR